VQLRRSDCVGSTHKSNFNVTALKSGLELLNDYMQKVEYIQAIANQRDRKVSTLKGVKLM